MHSPVVVPFLRCSSAFALACLLGLLASARPSSAQVSPKAHPIEITAKEAQQKQNVVTAPEGFEMSLFAAPPEVNYPTAIAATPAGDLFVAVDKNGSLDTKLGRGSILKATDSNDDGQADHYTVFVDSVDSPRGLVYDGERLYVMHPPTLTVYTDTNGDGVSDRSTDLVEGLGYGLDFRGADHTTNGMQMGIDGWLYIAVGDYGFFDAVGRDSQHIHHRGGGIVRVRPDGSELEIYATGLRNPYDVALDPYLNGFERGNTNDGHGWRVLLQHIVPQAEYGYPTLFRHFTDEIKPPLADYGGGSGAGALYVDAPGLPDSLGHTLYTADWGRGAVYRHELRPSGATFDPTQQVFTRIPQPTDIAIDGASNFYVSSWMGGGFRYTGENVGFIAQLRPKTTSPASTPNVGEATPERLLELLTSAHSLLRLHAQRELLRRDPGQEVVRKVAQIARSEEPRDVRVAAMFTVKQLEGTDSPPLLTDLLDDPSLRPLALRALADRKPQNENVPTEPFVHALDDENPRVRLEALNGLARLGAREAVDEMLPRTTDPDRTVAHVAVQSLVELEAVEPALRALRTGSPAFIEGAVQVLKKIHSETAVNGLIEVWRNTTDPYVRHQALAGLARLSHKEAKWKRGDWWGTTPSTRGPYYDPAEWAMSDQIRPVLRKALAKTDGIEYQERVTLFERNRAVPQGAGSVLLTAASISDSLKFEAVGALAGSAGVTDSTVGRLESLATRSRSLRRATIDLLVAQPRLPASAVSLLRTAALDESGHPAVRARILEALRRLSGEKTSTTVAHIHARLMARLPLPDPVQEALRQYVEAGDRAANADRFVQLARTGSRAEKRLAYAVLLRLGANDDRKETAKKARQAVANGWSNPSQAGPLLWAVGFTETEEYGDRVRQHLGNNTSSDIREAAQYAAARLGLSGSPD